jgi:hypothetical protein
MITGTHFEVPNVDFDGHICIGIEPDVAFFIGILVSFTFGGYLGGLLGSNYFVSLRTRCWRLD